MWSAQASFPLYNWVTVIDRSIPIQKFHGFFCGLTHLRKSLDLFLGIWALFNPKKCQFSTYHVLVEITTRHAPKVSESGSFVESWRVKTHVSLKPQNQEVEEVGDGMYSLGISQKKWPLWSASAPDRQRSERESRIISLPFHNMIYCALCLVEYVPFLDFSRISQEIEPRPDRSFWTDDCIQKVILSQFDRSGSLFEALRLCSKKECSETFRIQIVVQYFTFILFSACPALRIFVPISILHQFHPLITLLSPWKLLQMESLCRIHFLDFYPRKNCRRPSSQPYQARPY
jgi:hypothetical protein